MNESTVQLSEHAFALFEGTEEDKEQILVLHKGYLEANSIGLNVEALRKVWSADPHCVWFNSTGYTYKGIEDWATLWAFFGPRTEITKPWQSTDVRLIGNSDFAVITCERTAAGSWNSDDGEPHWTGADWPSRSTEAFRRENGKWICVHVHISTRETGLRPEQRG